MYLFFNTRLKIFGKINIVKKKKKAEEKFNKFQQRTKLKFINKLDFLKTIELLNSIEIILLHYFVR